MKSETRSIGKRAGLKYRLLFICGILLILNGCAVAKQVPGPDGQSMYVIDCSGPYLNVGHCLEKAGKICGGNGYELLGGYGANNGNMSTFGQFGYFSAPQISRELWIRCRNTPKAF